MPRRPLTRWCPNHPSSFPTSQRGRPRLPGVLRAHGEGTSPGSASPGVGAPLAGRLRRPHTETTGRGPVSLSSRTGPGLCRLHRARRPLGPASSPAANPAQPRRPRPRASLPRPRHTHRPARPQRRSGPGCPGRRARRLRTVTATVPSTKPGPSDPSEPPPRPDRRLFSSASNRHRPPRAPRPAAPRPPRPGSGPAHARPARTRTLSSAGAATWGGRTGERAGEQLVRCVPASPGGAPAARLPPCSQPGSATGPCFSGRNPRAPVAL